MNQYVIVQEVGYEDENPFALKIIKDEKVRNERIQEGLDNIKKYDLKTIAKKYIEFYEKNIIGD